eukprot:s1733_g17.t1
MNLARTERRKCGDMRKRASLEFILINGILGRRLLDKDATNRCNWYEFKDCCQVLGYQGDVPGAWRAFDDDLSGFISLKDGIRDVATGDVAEHLGPNVVGEDLLSGSRGSAFFVGDHFQFCQCPQHGYGRKWALMEFGSIRFLALEIVRGDECKHCLGAF